MAHQNGKDGMISYFLGVAPGSAKRWGTPTKDFWCCHGTLMQAHSSYYDGIFMQYEDGIAICQWIPSVVEFERGGQTIALKLSQDGQHGIYPLNEWSTTGMAAITKVDIPPIPASRPNRFVYRLEIACGQEQSFGLKLRIPWWVKGEPDITIDRERVQGPFHPSSFIEIKRTWKPGTVLHIEFPAALAAERLPGRSDLVAFLDGPIVLAGLVADERQLYGDPERPESLLVPHHERQHSWWKPGYYRTVHQDRGIRFIPLYEVKDESYTVYFSVKKR